MQIITKIRELQWEPNIETTLNRLIEEIEVYRFKKAGMILQQLLERLKDNN